MLTYLVVPALALLPAWLSGRPAEDGPAVPRQRLWRYSYLFAVLVLVVFAGARLFVGTDYNLYRNTFLQADPHYFGFFMANTQQEKGFTLAVLVLKDLTTNPVILFMVSSLITVGCSALAIRRMSTNFVFSLTLYVLLGFYLAPFNILRQGLAVALNFLAYSYLDKHKGRFVALNVVAQFLHSSTIIAVVLQLALRKAKPNARFFAIMLAGTAVATVAFAVLSAKLGFLNELNQRYTGYLAGQQSGIGTYIYLVSRLLLIALVVVYRPRNGEIDRYITLATAGVCLLALGTQSTAIGRLELYFGVYLVIAIPRALREAPKTARHLLTIGVLIGSLAFYFAYLAKFGNLLPYHFDLTLLGLHNPTETTLQTQ